MRRYEKPQMEIEKLEVSDIITISDIITGVADPESLVKENFGELVARENW